MKFNTGSTVTSRTLILDVAHGSGKRLSECKDSTSPSGYSLITKIACTYGGIVTNNLNMYRPDKMKDSSWMVGSKFRKNIGLPLIFGHDSDQYPIGRFIHSYYVDTSADYIKMDKHMPAFVSGSDSLEIDQALTIARKLAKHQLGKSGAGFQGLGYTVGIAKITDPDHIARVLDDRFFNVSTNQKTDYAACIVCGAPKLGNEPTCEHSPGDVVDGIPVFHLWNNMSYGEVSAVNIPAMPFAQIIDSKLIQGEQSKETIINIATAWANSSDSLYIHEAGANIELFSGVADMATEREIMSLIGENANMKWRVISKFINDVRAALSADSEVKVSDDGTLSVEVDKLKAELGDKFKEEWIEEVKDEATQDATTDQTKTETDPATTDAQSESASADTETDVSSAISADDRTEDEIDPVAVYNEMVTEMGSDELKDLVTDDTRLWQKALVHYYMKDGELDEESEDAKLTSEQRSKLKSSTFCGPNKSFPVPDCAHVTAALRLLGRYKGPGSKDSIRSCVMRKAKSMGCSTGEKKDSATTDSERSDALINIIKDWGRASDKDILDLAAYLKEQLGGTDMGQDTIKEVYKLLGFVNSEKIQTERDQLWQRLEKMHRLVATRDQEIATLKEEIDVAEDEIAVSTDKVLKVYRGMIETAAKLGLVNAVDTEKMTMIELEKTVIEVTDKIAGIQDDGTPVPSIDGSSAGVDDETKQRNTRITKGKITHAVLKDMLTLGGRLNNTMGTIRDARR